MLLLWLGLLARFDRIFFQRNSSFCVHFLLGHIPPKPEWDLPSFTQETLDQLDTLLKQKFHYLGKGGHCYAFVSEDKQFVIKFHRFASHFRHFSWVNHPISYRWNAKRQEIKDYNLQRLHHNFQNYKNSFLDLKEESGLLYMHINHSSHLNRSVRIVDMMGAEYCLDLDHMTFAVQKRAQLIYPTLDTLYQENHIEEAKTIIHNLLMLIVNTCKKGYIDNDPIFRRNYGLLGLEAIHIDLGDLVKQPEIERRENYLPYIKNITASLYRRIEKDYPQLLSWYVEELATL